MEISHPHRRELTVEEQQELDKLRQLIERVSADGVITRAERDQISAALRADGKVTYEELSLVRTLVQEKVAQGELTLNYDDQP
ncbi:hypothetical protein [Egbenema bharatensis]|uniref:hypothetical protein n=1 Tax=Egbenema bharatensis TaxID=3463334 RepID=UPI003A87EFDF